MGEMDIPSGITGSRALIRSLSVTRKKIFSAQFIHLRQNRFTLQQSANGFDPCGIALRSSEQIVTQSTLLAIPAHEHVYRIGTGIILAFDNKSSQITTYIK